MPIRRKPPIGGFSQAFHFLIGGVLATKSEIFTAKVLLLNSPSVLVLKKILLISRAVRVIALGYFLNRGSLYAPSSAKRAVPQRDGSGKA